MEGELVNIKKVDDLVIFFVNTTKPVKWRTRMASPSEFIQSVLPRSITTALTPLPKSA